MNYPKLMMTITMLAIIIDYDDDVDCDDEMLNPCTEIHIEIYLEIHIAIHLEVYHEIHLKRLDKTSFIYT